MTKLDEKRVFELAHQRAVECGIDFKTLTQAIDGATLATDRTGEIPDSFWTQFDVRPLNLNWVPDAYSSRPTVHSALGRAAMVEELGYADPGYAISMPGPGLSMPPLAALGNPEQQSLHFGRFDSDIPRWGAFAITEPSVGSDATAIHTSARKTTGGYVLNGQKCFITNGARADYVIVFANIARDRGRFGIRAFLVERGTAGFSVDRVEDMLGLRGSMLTALSFEDCRVPEENLLWGAHVGRHLDAFAAAQGAWDFMRPMLSCIIVGFCRRTRDLIAQYIAGGGPDGRPDWGQARVERYLADMDREIMTARLLAWQAAWKYEQGEAMSRDASMAKAYASRLAQQLVEKAMDVLGMAAFEPSSRLEKAWRDAKAFDILEGTGDMQRQMIASLHRRERTSRQIQLRAA
ncbi:acyl-CoA dehydrogenase family protein [Sphingobium sufflavum]|uniref:acyl-CoA dehydrogenase family protein n=1 Tax=Sphingobium sufflavum TaxID=1129547 RepID=UPI001F30E22F|nr:acyl-CoA dehydrogenase family protein [Sphingobium sufflavum]MCE7797230.1 acyl-CoA dehydrogenase family protein [Sphingobium sufflavum]